MDNNQKIQQQSKDLKKKKENKFHGILIPQLKDIGIIFRRLKTLRKEYKKGETPSKNNMRDTRKYKALYDSLLPKEQPVTLTAKPEPKVEAKKEEKPKPQASPKVEQPQASPKVEQPQASPKVEQPQASPKAEKPPSELIAASLVVQPETKNDAKVPEPKKEAISKAEPPKEASKPAPKKDQQAKPAESKQKGDQQKAKKTSK